LSDYDKIKAGFAGQSEIVAGLLESLTTEQWHAPSFLPGWDVYTLAAHIYRSPAIFSQYAANPVASPAAKTRTTYYDFDGQALGESITQRTRDTGSQFTPETLPSAFRDASAESLEIMRQLPPETVINTHFGTVRVDDFAAGRILEMTVHTFDLTLGLNLPPAYDREALEVTVAIMEALLGEPRPAALSDDVDFLLAASGRKPYPGLVIAAFS
jgi:uncharacterized protein (TIGR03083 family)